MDRGAGFNWFSVYCFEISFTDEIKVNNPKKTIQIIYGDHIYSKFNKYFSSYMILLADSKVVLCNRKSNFLAGVHDTPQIAVILEKIEVFTMDLKQQTKFELSVENVKTSKIYE